MSSYRPRETKRGRLKLSKNIARIYRSTKCRECSVVVTPMDFAKILGKFTKVKIQYENSNSPKNKLSPIEEVSIPNSNARLKSNENGMVLIHRNAYNQHPVKEPLYSPKKQKQSKVVNNTSQRQPSNILKENNRLKKTPLVKDKNSNYNKKNQGSKSQDSKHYGIIFTDPESDNNEMKIKVSLTELLPAIDNNILPSDEWDIDYFPKEEEPKEDKVYDRIAAELEDLMYNDKTETNKSEEPEMEVSKSDDFPSIMDILNDNSTDDAKLDEQITPPVNEDFKANLESSDVEAMLLGETVKPSESVAMDVDQNSVPDLVEDVTRTGNSTEENIENTTDKNERSHSPSILGDTLQTGIAQHLPDKLSINIDTNDDSTIPSNNVIEVGKPDNISEAMEIEVKVEKCPEKIDNSSVCKVLKPAKVSHVVFKQMKNGNCYRSVLCPKSLKYSIQLEGKSVELLGAPKFISSLEDLQVLLQIVNESVLSSCYVLH